MGWEGGGRWLARLAKGLGSPLRGPRDWFSTALTPRPLAGLFPDLVILSFFRQMNRRARRPTTHTPKLLFSAPTD